MTRLMDSKTKNLTAGALVHPLMHPIRHWNYHHARHRLILMHVQSTCMEDKLTYGKYYSHGKQCIRDQASIPSQSRNQPLGKPMQIYSDQRFPTSNIKGLANLQRTCLRTRQTLHNQYGTLWNLIFRSFQQQFCQNWSQKHHPLRAEKANQSHHPLIGLYS